jgi:hypothetical protein
VSLGLLLSVVALACGDDDDDVTSAGGGGHGGAGAAGGAQAQGGAGGEAPVCGTANGELPAGLTTLAWDDGVASTNLREQSFAITVDGDDFVLNEEPLHEAVRFDLDHPARVHGFSIRWGGLADDAPPTTELVAGLYGDFGYNGFDFWAPEPLFSGSRCAGDADDDGFVSYVFDEPIEIAHPGLIYVAHLAQPGEPVFDFDGTTANEEGSCALFDDCHSALNMPDALPFTYFNGVSFPFQYDFMVRLHVEYTDQVAPEEKIFQPLEPVAGAHASFGDIDADGDDDLITDGPTLWLNDGAGAFTDGTQASGIAALGVSATGGVFGDYDNDGCLDLFLYAESYTAPDVLLHNECDGTFTDRTAVAGISDVQSYEACGAPGVNVRSPTAAAAWLDIDADGFLDLFLANFICWDSGNTYVDEVWRNRGDGTFESWTATRGLSQLERASRGAAPVDADADGDVDLFVNTYRLQKNFFYDNLGDGTVAEVAGELGLGGEVSQGYYGHTIGGAWGDLDGDGRLDLVAANLAHPRFFDFSDKTQVLLQGSDGTFADLQGEWSVPQGAAGLRYQETHSVPALADFDQDGDLDLVITAIYDGRPTDFYWGDGDGTFTLDAYHAGITTRNGWGVALSDVDLDGDVDVFAGRPFRNDGEGLGHFVQVRVVGNLSANRAAIGATVLVDTPTRTLVRHVQGGTGKGGQDSLYLHFGLGDEDTVDAIRVVFPGSAAPLEVLGPFDADQRVWVYEDGTSALGWVNPT